MNFIITFDYIPLELTIHSNIGVPSTVTDRMVESGVYDPNTDQSISPYGTSVFKVTSCEVKY